MWVPYRVKHVPGKVFQRTQRTPAPSGGDTPLLVAPRVKVGGKWGCRQKTLQNRVGIAAA
jgi:hypothetical protein